MGIFIILKRQKVSNSSFFFCCYSPKGSKICKYVLGRSTGKAISYVSGVSTELLKKGAASPEHRECRAHLEFKGRPKHQTIKTKSSKCKTSYFLGFCLVFWHIFLIKNTIKISSECSSGPNKHGMGPSSGLQFIERGIWG